MSTVFHAKYFAHELTKGCPSDSVEKFRLFAASVDVRIRVKVAKIVAAVGKWQITPGKLLDLRANLGTDNRARVRHEIKALDLNGLSHD